MLQLAPRLERVLAGRAGAPHRSDPGRKRAVQPDQPDPPRAKLTPDASAGGRGVLQGGAVPTGPLYPEPLSATLPRLIRTGPRVSIETEPILFNSGEPDMRVESIQVLDRLAGFLKRRAELEVRVVGHTDNLGPDWANDAVSAERAAAVRDYLIGCGIDRRRVVSEGRGGREPVGPNDSPAGRKANRRIEFEVVQPK